MLCLSGGLAPPAPGPRERAMEPRVTLRVTCRGDTRSFLVSDPALTTWADVEAMVKVSFDLDNVQIKYIDEDNDEVSVNSKDMIWHQILPKGKNSRSIGTNWK